MQQFTRPLTLLSMLSVYSILSISSAVADVVLDGTLGPAGPLAGPNFDINETVGARNGNNLFHSFSEFNLSSAQSASFNGSAGIENIIGRVTGGALSTIDGTINSNIADANLFLMNPHGFIFGQNATISVDGSFYATSADYLALGNDGHFDAGNLDNTVLSSAAPSAFGFTGTTPGDIAVYEATFNIGNNETLGLIGGDVLLSGAVEPTHNPDGSTNYQITLNNGTVILAGLQSPGELQTTTLDVSAFSELGDVTLEQADIISNDVSNATLYVRSGELRLEDSHISAVYAGTDAEGDAISIVAREQLDIVYNGNANFRALLSSATAAGRGGDIQINTGDLNMSGNLGAAPNNGRVLIQTVATGSGRGGDIHINADRVLMNDNTTIQTETVTSADSGDINIVTDALTLRSNSAALTFIDASSRGLAGSTGGDVNIQANDIQLHNGSNGFVAIASQGSATSTAETANGGTINIDTDGLALTGGAQISAGVFRGAGQAGDVNISADDITIAGATPNAFPSLIGSTSGNGTNNTTGDGGNVSVTANRISLSDGGQINTFSNTSGNAGNIDIVSKDINIETGSFITATSTGTGTAGNVGVKADNIQLSGNNQAGGFTGIFSISGFIAAGAGDITIETGDLDIQAGAEVNNNTFGPGDGGTLTINADSISVNGSNANTGQLSRIRSGSENLATGNAGIININADTVNLSNQGEITTETVSMGAGGIVNLNTRELSLSSEGSISARSVGQGDAGSLDINVRESLNADNGRLLTSSELSAGGAMRIRAGEVALHNGSQLDSTTNSSFAGGDIRVEANQILMEERSTVTAATTGAGAAGDIDISGSSGITINDASLTSSTTGTGDGGEIRISGGSIAMSHADISSRSTGTGDSGQIHITGSSAWLNNTEISVRSSQSGLGGDVTIDGGQSLRLDQSRILTQAALSDGGNINLIADILIELNDSLVSSSVSDGSGGGGNINIDPQFVILRNSELSADARGGDGGNITIVTDHFFASPDSVLSASSELGIDGGIVIETPGNNLTQSLDKLSQKPARLNALARNDCQAVGSGSSSFIISKTPVVPVNYLAPVASNYEALSEKTGYTDGKLAMYSCNFY